MSTTEILQIINSVMLVATLPFSIILVYNLFFHTLNNRKDTIRYILMLIFVAITLAALFSLHVNYLLIFKKVPITDVLFEANVRNLIKNFAFLATSFGFWYIETKVKN